MALVTLPVVVTAVASLTGYSESSIYERIDARQDRGMFRELGMTNLEWMLLVYTLVSQGHHLGWATMRADDIARNLRQYVDRAGYTLQDMSTLA